ncbi:hypothetical protein lerEdw1_003685 [Lerista edwardsae]|nr:hypothetical protein lerEdw1_003685 [Lerista edwardsae]
MLEGRSYCSGVTSQATITQPASMSVSLGQTAKFSCTKSSGGSWESWFTWLQQTPGQGPRFVIFGGSGYTTEKGDGIPDRFTLSFSGNVGTLTINNLQPEDEADYYCVSWYSTGVRSYATLTQPPSQSVSLGDTVRLTCSLSREHQNYIVQWYQQREGQPPRLLLYKDTNRASGIPDRFSGSKSGGERYLTIASVRAEDEATSPSKGEGIPDRFSVSFSGNVGYLTINNVQAEDEADYYCLAWYGTGVSSQPSVTQPASQSVSLGQTVKFSCSKSSDGSWGSFSWYQQRAGQGPRFLWYGSSTRGDGVPDRFTSSSSGTNGYLTIANAQPEDEADYYCGIWEYTGVSSQATLTQLASMSESPGQTAKLSCTRSSGGSWNRYFNWYQQKEGEAPRFVIYGCDGCTPSRGEGIPDRFTVSSSGNVGSLTINNLQPEDEANYYCAVWYSTGSMSHSDAF